MAMLSCVHIILPLIFLLVFLLARRRNKNELPWNFPLIGITPWFLLNLHRLNESLSKILEKSNGTFVNKSRCLLNYDILLTSDPSNVHHVMNKKFLMYPKGLLWRKRFDIFEESMFNLDFDEWSYHRSLVRGFLSHHLFHENSAKAIRECMEEKLIPFLVKVSADELVVDLQDVLHRMTFDFASIYCTGHQSNSLGVGVAPPQFLKAIDDACEAIFARHIFPDFLWKLQRWFLVGKERKMKEAHETLDRVFETYLSMKQNELKARKPSRPYAFHFDVLELYVTGHELFGGRPPTYGLMKSHVISLLFAMGDTMGSTLTWFFLLLSQHPLVESKIKVEVSKAFTGKTVGAKDLGKMVYVHACLCETLRLFPVVPFEARTAVEADTLPSGHKVDEKTMILLCTYAMGRMSKVWGDDCLEFKPERWITEDGRIKHEPSHKFFAFNSGPRICPGKDFAFTFMKTVIATIMHNFHVQVVQDHPVAYTQSIVLKMEHGLKAKFSPASN